MTKYEKDSFLFYFVGMVVVSVFILIVCLFSSIIDADAGIIVDMNRIAQIESHNNPRAWNKGTNARGTYQITDCVLQDWNASHKSEQYTSDDLFNHAVNEKIAIWYFETKIVQYLKHYKLPVTIENKLIAYHDGIGNLIKYVKGKRRLGKYMKLYLKKYGV